MNNIRQYVEYIYNLKKKGNYMFFFFKFYRILQKRKPFCLPQKVCSEILSDLTAELNTVNWCTPRYFNTNHSAKEGSSQKAAKQTKVFNWQAAAEAAAVVNLMSIVRICFINAAGSATVPTPLVPPPAQHKGKRRKAPPLAQRQKL